MRGALIAGAAGAVLVLVIYALAGFTDRSLFPWFEGNQGFLSVLALAIALVFALIENHRANTAAADRRTEYVDAVLALFDEMDAVTAKFFAAIDVCERDGTSTELGRNHWSWDRARLNETLTILRPSAPPDGPLAIALSELQFALEDGIAGGTPEETRANLAEFDDRLAKVKPRIVARR